VSGPAGQTNRPSAAQARADVVRARRTTERERDQLLMQAPVGTAILLGPELVFSLANPSYCRLVGRSEAQLIGKPWVQAFPELADTEIPGILHHVYISGEPHISTETRVELDVGESALQELYVEFNLQALHDLEGSVYGLMAVVVDITTQVRARQAMERSQAEREDLLLRAESAARAKDEFLAMLGHELRNPLAPIVSALHVMAARGDSSTEREQAVIRRQVSHLTRLVDDLLDIARITRGRVVLKPSSSEVADIVQRAVEMVQPLLEERRHRLHIRQPEVPLRWWGDAARLVQVLSNLLTNAARYTQPDGEIWLDVRQEAGEVRFEVRDTGAGIRPEVLPHVFDLFYQSHARGADRAEGGLGLGLALVKNLVTLHGGTAEAHSDGPGRGSRFIVRLPLRSQAPGKAAAAPVAHAAGVRPRRVLIVDDNRDAAQLLAQILRMEGHETREVFDPMEALKVAEQLRPEVAIFDIGLPGMDGHELAREFQRRFHAAPCKLIALTGYGQDSDHARGAAAGFACYLTKPVNLEALRGALGN